MNRKAIVAGILVCLIIAGSVFAQGTVVTIGGSYWRGMMKAQDTDNEKDQAWNLFGPYINLRSDKLTLGGSWFFGSLNYDEQNFKLQFKRSDLNLSLGYSLNNNLTIFGAYKILKITVKEEGENLTTREFDAWKVPYIGGGASLTFAFENSPLFLFGSAAYLVNAKDEMTWTYAGRDYTDKIDDKITSVTLGLGARLESGMSILVGYRADIHKSEKSEDDETITMGDGDGLKINGLFATIAFSFRQ